MDRKSRYRIRGDTPPPPRRKAAEFAGRVQERTLAMPLPDDPRMPAAHDDRDIAALKALKAGGASANQQQRALEWIVHCAARTYVNTFSGDSALSDYAQGKRAVGLEIVKLLNSKTTNQDDSEHG